MTEELWKLRKENAALKKALIEAQSVILQQQYREAVAADKALGDTWQDEPAKVKSVK